jgi:hypothetical protein
MNIHCEKGQKDTMIFQMEARIIKGKKFEKEESQKEKDPKQGREGEKGSLKDKILKFSSNNVFYPCFIF